MASFRSLFLFPSLNANLIFSFCFISIFFCFATDSLFLVEQVDVEADRKQYNPSYSFFCNHARYLPDALMNQMKSLFLVLLHSKFKEAVDTDNHYQHTFRDDCNSKVDTCSMDYRDSFLNSSYRDSHSLLND